MTIKQEIKSFYSKLSKEIKKREKYVASKPISWQISEVGEAYIETTTLLDGLLSLVENQCRDLQIDLPINKK